MKTPTCQMCPNPLPTVAIREGDPFCSTDCARAYYENPLPGSSIWSRYPPTQHHADREKKAS